MSLPKELGLPSHLVGKQVRCVYGTRDAGAIWEDTYRVALETAGFTSGIASPCIFQHYQRDITCVVHGDDFTSLGSDPSLDWLEAKLAESFELKIRGRLGVGCPGDNEIRILNRVVRITDEGLEYEADPRHVDLISESLELVESNKAVTPGVKNIDPNTEGEKDLTDPIPCGLTAGDLTTTSDQSLEPCDPQNIGELFAALTSDNELLMTTASTKVRKSVTFNSDLNTTVTVSPYARYYGFLPHTKVATCDGWKDVQAHTCRYTGKTADVIKARRLAHSIAHDRAAIDVYRRTMLRT